MDVLRLARSEAAATAAVAVAMQAAGAGAVAVEPLADGMLVALGPGRYVNRSIGVGPDLDDDHLDVIEHFFAQVGVPAAAQVSSRADATTVRRLTERGLRPQWFRAVHAAALPSPPPSARPVGHDELRFVEVDDHTVDDWLQVLAEGNGVSTGEPRRVSDEFGRAAHRAAGAVDLLALLDDRPVGCGSLQVAGGVAWLGAAATVPDARGRGVQQALIGHRVRLAADAGCELVAATALPNGPSVRNLARHGLGLVDVQLVFAAEPRAPT
jgi:GNAT superfamily N-acetyltransferase